MVNIDCLIFGYRRFKVKKEDMAKAADLLLKNEISTRISEDGVFVIGERRVKKVRALLSDAVAPEVSEVRGAYGCFLRYRRCYGVFCGLFALLLLCIALGGRVWDVRVTGDGTLSSLYVEEALSEAGLCIGMPFSELELSEVEGRVLRLSPRIAWVNINRRGSVVYAEVIGRADSSAVSKKDGYANLIADEDAWIEEITPLKGTAVVHVGESVKAGDLLISGMSDRLCYAEGSVRGRVERRISVTVPYRESVTLYERGGTLSRSVNFFGFSLNIFKTYGNPPIECDIIEETDRLTLFGSLRLPVFVTRRIAVLHETVTVPHAEAECTRIAAARLAARMRGELSTSELLRIRTSGEFTAEGYCLYADVLLSREIAGVKEFQAKE